MKKNLKNILWVGISALALILFIIAVDAIGIKMETHINDTVIGHGTATLDLMVKSARNGTLESTGKDVMGLWISGLVFTAIIVVLAISKMVLGFVGKDKKVSGFFWDIAMLVGIIFVTILMIAGSSLYIDNGSSSTGTVVKTTTKANGGIAFAHFLMLFVPVLLTPIPLLLNKVKTKKSK